MAESVGWTSSTQIHSGVEITTDEAHTGDNSLLIHQDAYEPYPGDCSMDACAGTGGGFWPNSYAYHSSCSFETNGGDKCNLPDYPDCGTCEFNDGANLGWPYTNRVMWAKMVYNTSDFNLKPGQEYTFTFYYKGHLAGDLSIRMCYGLGWCSQSRSCSYCQGIGDCSSGCPINFDDPNDVCGQCRFVNYPYQTDGYPTISLGSIPAGDYPEWGRYAYTFEYTEAMANTLDSNGDLRNEVGMTIGYNNTGSQGTDVYIDDVQFQRGSLREVEISFLPELQSPAVLAGDGDLIKEFLFSVEDSGDAIGLKVISNPKRLTPLSWYKENVPNPGSPSRFSIDNYYALQEGRTVYVGATDVEDSSSITWPQYNSYYLYLDDATARQFCIEQGYLDFESYSESEDYPVDRSRYTGTSWTTLYNPFYIEEITCVGDVHTYIYLISYNNGASSETIEIFNQLLANWRFNVNISDPDDKAEIQRDLLRLYDLKEIKTKLGDYKLEHGQYPTLGAGTYVLGQTNSKWPSWQNVLGQALGSALPADPVNDFNGPCAGCPDDPNEPDYQCQGTCYNTLTEIFDHPNGSHVYQYYAPQNEVCLGQYYTFKLNLEYGSGGLVWEGEEDIITIQPDSSGTFNYIYVSSGAPVCGDEVVQCGEQCDCGGGYQTCCSPFQAGYCPGATFPSVGFVPDETCENLGFDADPTGFLECGACSWSGSSCAKKIDGESCISNENCSSGNCVDGVCCDTACDGLCQYCGDGYGGSAGVCHIVSTGDDPRDVCNDTSGCLTGNCMAGACTDYYSSGDRNCPTCQTCDGDVSPGTCVPRMNNTQDTEGFNLCQATCEKCFEGLCINQTSAQDLFDHCSQTWNTCDNPCFRRGADGYCDGSGACDTNDRGGDIASGQICLGNTGTAVNVDVSNYCGSYENDCVDNSCQGARWFRSCDGAGWCRSPGDHTDAYQQIINAGANYVLNSSCGEDFHSTSNFCSTIVNTCTDGDCSGYRYYRGCDGSGACRTSTTGAFQQTVYADAGKTLTAGCGPGGVTLCNYSSWNACSGYCVKKRDELRCNAGHSCAYVVGDDTTPVQAGYICLNGSEDPGSCATCQQCDGSGTCDDVSNGTDPFNDCGTSGCLTGLCLTGACNYYTSGQQNCAICEECNASGQCSQPQVSGDAATLLGCNAGDEGCRYCEDGSCQYFTSDQHDCPICHACDSNGNCSPQTVSGTPPILGCGTGYCDSGNCVVPCECITGACCDGCYYRPSTHVCRAALDPCDIQETCTGSSYTCPADTYVANGTECGDCSTCTDGVCTGRGVCTPGDGRHIGGGWCEYCEDDCTWGPSEDGCGDYAGYCSDCVTVCGSVCSQGEFCCAFQTGCFTAGTLVKHGQKQKKIEEIKVGDIIDGYDSNTNKIQKVKVVKIFEHQQSNYYIIKFADFSILEVTDIHPLYTQRGYLKVKDLNIWDEVGKINNNGRLEFVKIIKIKKAIDQQTVYNLEVDQFHNYFANGFLVHNKEYICNPGEGIITICVGLVQ